MSAPPFGFNTLKAPLSPSDRARIMAYLEPFWAKSAGGTAPTGGITSPTWHDFQGYSDQSVINSYDSIVGNTPTPPGADPGYAQGYIGPNPAGNVINGAATAIDALVSVPQFLGKLSNGNTWIRVAEFGIGILLVGVAANALLKNNKTYQATRSTVNSGVRVAKKVAA